MCVNIQSHRFVNWTMSLLLFFETVHTSMHPSCLSFQISILFPPSLSLPNPLLIPIPIPIPNLNSLPSLSHPNSNPISFVTCISQTKQSPFPYNLCNIYSTSICSGYASLKSINASWTAYTSPPLPSPTLSSSLFILHSPTTNTHTHFTT